jgi:hypothetical protein
MLKCPFGLVYIGQMKRALKLRIVEHKTANHTTNIYYAIAHHDLGPHDLGPNFHWGQGVMQCETKSVPGVI